MIIMPAVLEHDGAVACAKIAPFDGVAPWVQIDVLDDTYRPNKTAPLVDLVPALGDLNIEVHFMVERPEEYITGLLTIGPARIVFAIEAVESPTATLDTFSRHPFIVGVAINPETPIDAIAPYADRIASVLLMGVDPGRQGQPEPFDHSVLSKISQIRRIAPHCLIGADGGISAAILPALKSAGVDYVCIGSGIFKTKDPIATWMTLQKSVA